MNPEITDDNITHSKLIQFFPIGTAQVNLDNVLTIGKLVYPSMRVIKIESNHIDAIEILNVEEDPEGYVNVLVRDIGIDRIFELTQILDPENKYFVWTIISYDYFINCRNGYLEYLSFHTPPDAPILAWIYPSIW